jgi:hypothetical protein
MLRSQLDRFVTQPAAMVCPKGLKVERFMSSFCNALTSFVALSIVTACAPVATGYVSTVGVAAYTTPVVPTVVATPIAVTYPTVPVVTTAPALTTQVVAAPSVAVPSLVNAAAPVSVAMRPAVWP